MYRTWCDTVPETITGIAHFLRRVIEIASRVEGGDQAIGLSNHGRSMFRAGSALLNADGITEASFVFRRLVVNVGLWRDGLELRHRHHWQETNEEKEQHGEHAERPEEGEDFNDRGAIISPARRQEIAGKRCYNDHEALEPHPHVDENREHPNHRGILAHRLEPEELGCDRVTGDHDPVSPRVMAKRSIDKREAFIWIR